MEDYYMSLPKDLSGSISKNRFRMELLWGINKIIDSHKELDEYTVIFDFKCDIEIHKKNEISFFQIKTVSSSNFNANNLCKIKKGKCNSILGKLYALYSPDRNIKLVIVCNKQLKINKKVIDSEVQCFGNLDSEVICTIQEKLSEELSVDTVRLDNVFYLYDGMNFINPEDAIRGKLIKAFEDLTGEEPINPNAFYRLVYDAVKEKASYELNLTSYEDVVSYKGISRSAFDKMLNAHKKESQNGISDTHAFIKTMPPIQQREFNKAMSDLLALPRSVKMEYLKDKILNFINDNISKIQNEYGYLSLVCQEFNHEFDIEFSDSMKKVQYLILYYRYLGGEDID